jgi:hypothetical protein
MYIKLEKRENGRHNIWQCEIDSNIITYTWGTSGGKQQVLEQIVKEGKNKGRTNETTPEQQAVVEARGKVNKKLDGGYVIVEKTDWEDIELNETRQVPKPMLAYEFHDSQGHLREAMEIANPAKIGWNKMPWKS